MLPPLYGADTPLKMPPFSSFIFRRFLPGMRLSLFSPLLRHEMSLFSSLSSPYDDHFFLFDFFLLMPSRIFTPLSPMIFPDDTLRHFAAATMTSPPASLPPEIAAYAAVFDYCHAIVDIAAMLCCHAKI